MYSRELLMMDGKTVRNMYSVIPKQNKFDTLVHLVGFTTETAFSCHNRTIMKLQEHRKIMFLLNFYCTVGCFLAFSSELYCDFVSCPHTINVLQCCAPHILFSLTILKHLSDIESFPFNETLAYLLMTVNIFNPA